MLKKSISLSFVAILTACGILQFPKYVVSDEDLKKLAIAENQVDQCVNTDFVKKIQNKQKLSDDEFIEAKVRLEVLQNNSRGVLLGDIIGREKVEIIKNDFLSAQNFLNRYNPKLASLNIPPLGKVQCAVVKKNYMQVVQAKKAELKQQIANQKIQAKEAEKARKAREAYYQTPEGQAELARQQQERHHQEMMALQRQQMGQLQAAQNAMQFQQQMNQMNQMNQQMQQRSMQMLQMATPQKVIIGSPVMNAPIMGTGPRWNNVY
ncbi:DUF5358 family protein [Rodentibacter haemolyticus]|uniref:Uncharacterized protein n=1 Tax=Rodentibacter haemolyticus TaxID=2778911 RepID=A0ABX6V2R0_9PAST|nr:DUF5358 family protein [Rodentibacter haemolyticus]QPB43606.1 hypothetical protein IHV77_05955 [Rodentibacter haemolyticus]